MIKSKYIGLAKKLDVTPLSEAQLAYLEKVYAIKPRLFGPFCEEQNIIDAILGEAAKRSRFA